jgi:uncharacterized coiled-coil DUF342 family protein
MQLQEMAEHQIQMDEAVAEHNTAFNAWRKERARLASERDGAVAQVNTLRDKVSELSQDLATADDSQGQQQVYELPVH